jgi:hypothetical protein
LTGRGDYRKETRSHHRARGWTMGQETIFLRYARNNTGKDGQVTWSGSPEVLRTRSRSACQIHFSRINGLNRGVPGRAVEPPRTSWERKDGTGGSLNDANAAIPAFMVADGSPGAGRQLPLEPESLPPGVDPAHPDTWPAAPDFDF